MKRRTTKREDAAFLARAFEGATRTWKVGDECQGYRGAETTTVVRIEGDIVHLADGTSIHRSRMRGAR